MTPAELDALIARHGGLASEPDVLDPVIDNPDKKLPSDPDKVENPTPNKRYVFKDGKSITLRATLGPGTEGQGTTYTVTDAGTALEPDTTKPAPTASAQLDKLDARGNVIPATDTTTPVAKLRDPKTGATIDMPDPKTQPEGKLTEFGNDLLLVKPDGTFTVVTSKDPKATTQAKSVHQGPNGELIEYDPNKPEGQRTTVITQGKPEKPTVAGPSDVTWTDIPGTNQQQGNRVVDGVLTPVEGLTRNKATTVYGTGPNDQFRVTLDDQGNVVSQEPNPNYQPPKATQLTADTVSPNVPLLQPDGSVKWVPNQNRVTAGQAMQDMLAQVGVKVNGGDLSMDDAKNMLTGAVNTMNAQTSQLNAQTSQMQAVTTAANTILEQQRQGATTGAGLLQNRVTNAQGMLNSILGVAGQGQRSGNLGGGLMNVPAGLGQQLVSGIQGWATELGGGQGVYDTAARLVTQADPNNGQSPEAHVAMGVLSQMLERYQGLTGQAHPAVAATNAASASAASNGMAAPNVFNPQASTAALNAAGFQDTPEGRAAAIAAGRGDLLKTPQPAAPFVAPTTAATGGLTGQTGARLPVNPALMPGYINPWSTTPQPAPNFGSASFIAPPTPTVV